MKDFLNCEAVVAELYVYLDREVGSDRAALIKDHLQYCTPCEQQLAVENMLKAMVRRSCSESAPTELRARILTRITTIQVELG